MPQLYPRFLDAHLVPRRGQIAVAIGAREHSITEAGQLCGLPFGTLRSRLRAGMSIADALTKPVDPHDRRRPADG